MKLRLASALPAAVDQALDPLKGPLYSKPGMRLVAIVELAHIERLEVAPNEDKEASVTIGLKSIEVAHGEQVDHLQRAAHALHIQRTAWGTIDEDLGALSLNKHLLEGLADHFALRETARLRAALVHLHEVLERLEVGAFSEFDMRKQVGKIRRIAKDAMDWQEPDEDGD